MTGEVKTSGVVRQNQEKQENGNPHLLLSNYFKTSEGGARKARAVSHEKGTGGLNDDTCVNLGESESVS